MTIVGGLRTRLLQDSFLAVVEEGIRAIGWLDVGRSHQPVRLQAEPANWREPIAPNLIAVDLTAVTVVEVEVGSWLTADTTIAYADLYAESEALGVELSNDIRDILRGRLDLNVNGTLPIYDYRQATPSVVGRVAITEVNSLRATAAAQEPWQRHWFRVRCELIDTYYSTEV